MRQVQVAGEPPGSALTVGDLLSDGNLVARAYRDDVAGIPVLGDLEGFQDLARQLEPESFSDLVKIMGNYAWQGRHSRASSASAQYI